MMMNIYIFMVLRDSVNNHELPPHDNNSEFYYGDMIVFKTNNKSQLLSLKTEEYENIYNDLFQNNYDSLSDMDNYSDDDNSNIDNEDISNLQDEEELNSDLESVDETEDELDLNNDENFDEDYEIENVCLK